MSLPILITGGSQRLGLAIAQHLLANDQPVIITYRRHKPSVDELKNVGAIVLEADFSTQAGISRAIEEIKRNKQHISIQSIGSPLLASIVGPFSRCRACRRKRVVRVVFSVCG